MGAKENVVQRSVISRLKLLRVPHFRNNTGVAWLKGAGGQQRPVAFGARGWPDIVAVLPDGKFLGVECKSETGKQSPEQRDVQEMIDRSGGLYLLVRSADDFDRQITDRGYFVSILSPQGHLPLGRKPSKSTPV